MLLRGLKDNFEAQGYLVRTAKDGQKGLDALLTAPPDLLLLDLMLPKVNGYEICRTARSRQLDMPIIMLTAKGQEDDIVRGLELGADDYVTKPFSIRELIARVKAFLRRQGPEGASYEFGDCRLDLEAHKLFKRGGDRAYCQGVPFAGVPRKAGGARADPGQHSGGGVGRGGHCDRPQRGPLRYHAARQARGRLARAALHPHDPGHWVPL